MGLGGGVRMHLFMLHYILRSLFSDVCTGLFEDKLSLVFRDTMRKSQDCWTCVPLVV